MMVRRRRRLGGASRGRAVLWLAAAGVLAAAAAALAGRAAAERPSRDAVLVVRAAIPAGTALDDSRGRALLALAPVPEGLALPGLLRDVGQIAGRRTAVPLAPGEPVTEAALGGAPGTGPAPLAPGERAISVPTALAGVAAGALRPGVHVDVVASAARGPSGRSAVVVADAEVLATGGGDPAGPDGDAASALLRVSPAAALRLTEALNFAQEVRIVIRPLGEAGR